MKMIPKDNIQCYIYCSYPGYTTRLRRSSLDYFVFNALFRHYNGSYNIKIEEGKGTLMLHPMNSKIKIDFTQQCYGIPQRLHFDLYYGSLKYLVTNLRENINANFYSENLDSNPFKVCHGTECVTDVSKYIFQKGEVYAIEVELQKFILYNFSICNNNSYLKFNLFLLLFLIMIIFHY